MPSCSRRDSSVSTICVSGADEHRGRGGQHVGLDVEARAHAGEQVVGGGGGGRDARQPVVHLEDSSESGSRPAARAPSHAQPIFSATRSTDRSRTACAPSSPARRLALIPTMSASRPARRRTAWAPAADEDRGVRVLHRLREAFERPHGVVPAGEVERLGAEEALDHGQRLGEAAHAHAGRVELRSRPLRSRRSSSPRRGRAPAGRRTRRRAARPSGAPGPGGGSRCPTRRSAAAAGWSRRPPR